MIIVGIILCFIAFIIMLILMVAAAKDEDYGFCIGILVIGILVMGLIMLPFLVLDKGSGSTIGTITSVDKNFFGTTAIYIKTSETEQEEYCAENEHIIKLAKKYIGKKVKIDYETRVGIYDFSQCHQAPIKKIILEENINEKK